MKLVKIHIEFEEKELVRQSIIETIFSFYAVNGVIEKRYTSVDVLNRLVFNMYSRETGLMRHDISLLRMAGYNVKEVRDF